MVTPGILASRKLRQKDLQVLDHTYSSRPWGQEAGGLQQVQGQPCWGLRRDCLKKPKMGPDDPRSSPRMYMLERENQLLRVVLRPPHVHRGAAGLLPVKEMNKCSNFPKHQIRRSEILVGESLRLDFGFFWALIWKIPMTIYLKIFLPRCWRKQGCETKCFFFSIFLRWR